MLEGQGSATSTELVTDLALAVTDLGAGVTVSGEVATVVTSQFKYPTRISISSLVYSQAEPILTVDWASQVPGGRRYYSFFDGGYRIRGDGMRDQQANYITIYATPEPTRCTLRSLWDYAVNDVVKRWSIPQTIYASNENYSYAGRRLKIRGHGKVMQLRVESVDDYDFNITGWSILDSVNSGV